MNTSILPLTATVTIVMLLLAESQLDQLRHAPASINRLGMASCVLQGLAACLFAAHIFIEVIHG